MRIADIMKQSTQTQEEPKAPSPAPTPAPPQAIPPTPPPQEPAIDIDEIKRKVQQDLERQLREKEAAEQQKESEALAKQQKEIAEQQKKIEELSSQLKSQVEKQKQEDFQKILLEKLEEQRKQFEDQIQKQLAGNQQEVEKLRQTLDDKDKQLQQKEETLREERLKQAAEASQQKTTPEPPVPETKNPEEPSPPKPEAKEPSPAPPVASAPVPKPKTETPSAPSPLPDIPKKVEEAVASQQEIEDKQKLYMDISELGKDVLKKIVRGDDPGMDVFKDVIRKVIRDLENEDGILIGCVQQPYPHEEYFSYHATNCMILSVVIGMDLDLEPDEILNLALAAYFHDVALVDIQDDLDYPKELNDKTKKEVRDHPVRGAQMMKKWLSEDALQAIRHHHETCDGGGYPKGMKEKEICLPGKIVNVVDVFEAMTHSRPYRKALPVNQAIKNVVEQGRGAYDRRILKSLMSYVGLYPVMTLVELSNKQIGRVVKQNRKHPLSPVIKVEFDEMGHKLKKSLTIDLSESRLIHITGSLEEVESYQAKKRTKFYENKVSLMSILGKVIPFVVMLSVILMVGYIVFKL